MAGSRDVTLFTHLAGMAIIGPKLGTPSIQVTLSVTVMKSSVRSMTYPTVCTGIGFGLPDQLIQEPLLLVCASSHTMWTISGYEGSLISPSRGHGDEETTGPRTRAAPMELPVPAYLDSFIICRDNLASFNDQEATLDKLHICRVTVFVRAASGGVFPATGGLVSQDGLARSESYSSKKSESFHILSFRVRREADIAPLMVATYFSSCIIEM